MPAFLARTDLPIKFVPKNKSTALTRINPCANIHVPPSYDREHKKGKINQIAFRTQINDLTV